MASPYTASPKEPFTSPETSPGYAIKNAWGGSRNASLFFKLEKCRHVCRYKCHAECHPVAADEIEKM